MYAIRSYYEKKDGAFLAYLLREKITGKSQFQEDIEVKAAEQKRLEDKSRQQEEERLRRHEEQSRISLEKFLSLSRKEKGEILSEFV